ncbi:MAG TPA: histidine phosphatase family protein [Nocardioidaceae bacterium]|nr:histidine phosphatase family protein [Nocardioidaceae bacterium]
MRPRWTTGPASLTLVRHAHSLGNRADARARAVGAEALDLEHRDAELELSEVGLAQAEALGRWLAAREEPSRPTVVVSSPYRRTMQTAERAVAHLGLEVLRDERVRERAPGVLDGLTEVGIRRRHPEEVERRDRHGAFYYQPPRGESWCDVSLRVRSFLDGLRFGYDGARVWVFTHQAVVMAFRYVLEELSEERLLEMDRTAPPANASVTTYLRSGEVLELERFADTTVAGGADAMPHRPVGDRST